MFLHNITTTIVLVLYKAFTIRKYRKNVKNMLTNNMELYLKKREDGFGGWLFQDI